MNMKWGEAREDHNCCDFARQENTSLRAMQEKHEKEEHHGKKKQEYHELITTGLL